LDRIETWRNGERAYFTSHAAEAEKLGSDPAETMLANVLLNLAETLTKE
jgi:hypothetical protein